jgi:predicted enzyme related to lactoylglutathione lyase
MEDGMIQYKEIAFVAYPVTDTLRARKFYEDVLGLQPNEPLKAPDQQWIEYDIGPGTLGIGRSPNWLPSEDGPSLALEVVDFEAALETLKKHNIPLLIGTIDLPSCRMVTVRDPDGNKITLHKRRAKAG